MERSGALAEKPIALPHIAVVLIAGTVLGLVAWSGLNKDNLGLFHDDGIYTVVAKSLAEGEGYRIASLPNSPPQTKYPFLYSYLLAGAWKLKPSFPENIIFLKGANVTILVALFFASVLFYRQTVYATQGKALLYALLVTTNPIVFSFTDFAVSDLLLVLLTMGTLVLISAGAEARHGMSRVISLAAVGGMACLTRLAGLPLIFAGALHAFGSKGFRGFGVYALAVWLIVAPWIFWILSASLPSENSLFAYYLYHANNSARLWTFEINFSQQMEIALANLRYLAHAVELIYLTPLAPGLNFVIYGMTAWGIFLSIQRHNFAFWIFVLAYAALITVWPFHPVRYIAPLIPALVLFLFRGMAGAESFILSLGRGERWKRTISKLAWLPLAIILLLDGVWLSSYFFNRDEATTRSLYGRRLPYSWKGFVETFMWIRENTEQGSILATAFDPMYYLYTGRKAIRPALHNPESYFYPFGHAVPDVGSVALIKPQLATLGVRYLIVDPLDGYAERDATIKLFDELIMSYGAKAQLVFISSDLRHRIYALSEE